MLAYNCFLKANGDKLLAINPITWNVNWKQDEEPKSTAALTITAVNNAPTLPPGAALTPQQKMYDNRL